MTRSRLVKLKVSVGWFFLFLITLPTHIHQIETLVNRLLVNLRLAK